MYPVHDHGFLTLEIIGGSYVGCDHGLFHYRMGFGPLNRHDAHRIAPTDLDASFPRLKIKRASIRPPRT